MHLPRQNAQGLKKHTVITPPCRDKRVKIGILLLEARMVSSTVLNLSVQTAEDMNKPLGRVLVENCRITEMDLENVLLAQSMIESGLLDRTDAVSALRYARDQSLPFSRVTKWLALGEKTVSNNEDLMIELLLGSDMTDSRSVQEAKRIAVERDMTVAGALLKMRAVSFYAVNMAVECMKLILDNRLNKAQSLKLLRLAKDSNYDLETAFEKSGISAKNTLSKIKIGDILLSARIVSETELLSSLERSIKDNRLLGELLIEAGILSKELLDESLFLQRLCQLELMTRQAAAKLIKKAHESGRSVKSITKEMGTFRDNPATFNGAIALLTSAELTEESSICSAVKHYSDYGMDPLHALVSRGAISVEVYKAAVELANMIANGDIEEQQAVRVLYQCELSKCSFSEAMEQLSINCYQKQESRQEQSITSGLEKKFSLPNLVNSVEFLLLAAVVVLTTTAAFFLNLHATELVVATGAIFILVVSIFASVSLIRMRSKRMQACHQEIDNRIEQAKQEINRLKRLKQL